MELFAVVVAIMAGQIGNSVWVTYMAAREGEGGAGSALVHVLLSFVILLLAAAVAVGFGWDGTGWIFVALPLVPALEVVALVVARRLGAARRQRA